MISVIVPVYNVGPYLKACIDSVLLQTYTEWEAILVDDGSTDESGQICDEYAQKYKNIRALHQNRKGAGQARNVGVAEAKGEYIYFLDSDDRITEDLFEFAMQRMTATDADIISFGFLRVSTDEEAKAYVQTMPYEEKEYDNAQAMQMFLKYEFDGYVWSRMYRRHVVESQPFNDFPLHEDAWVLPNYFDAAKKVLVTNKVCYYYYRRPGSLMNRSFGPENFCYCMVYEKTRDFVKEKYPKYEKEAEAALLLSYVSMAEMMQGKRAYKSYRKEYELYRKKTRSLYNSENKRLLPVKARVAIGLWIWMSPVFRLCCYLYYKWRRWKNI